MKEILFPLVERNVHLRGEGGPSCVGGPQPCMHVTQSDRPCLIDDGRSINSFAALVGFLRLGNRFPCSLWAEQYISVLCTSLNYTSDWRPGHTYLKAPHTFFSLSSKAPFDSGVRQTSGIRESFYSRGLLHFFPTFPWECWKHGRERERKREREREKERKKEREVLSEEK